MNAPAPMKIVLFANTDWYLYNFRRSLALALRDAGHDVLLLSPPGEYGARLQALGLRWQAAPMDRRSLNPLGELKLLLWLARLFKRERPALVHGFTIKCAVYGSLAARWAGVPARVNAVAGMGYVFTSNDLKARLLRTPVRLLLRLALGGPGARLILQNPDDVALFAKARLVDPAHVRLIAGSGVDCRRFTASQPPPDADGRFRVLLAARLAGVPARVNAVAGMGYVFTSNDTKARVLRPLVRALRHAALDGRKARLILQNPDDVALFQRAGFVDAAHIRLIPGSGVDCSRFDARDGGRDAGKPLRVLLAARLLWDKGLAEFVAAARQLRGEGRAIEFLLAGDPDPGNPAAVPEETVRGWVDEGLLQWLGHIDDMPALFASVDVVVLPSYREGLPKGLIEAAACALPLVTTDVPGCREVVSDGIDGLLVPPRDAAALAAAIARLHDDPALAAKLGTAARAKALARFDERIVIEHTIAVYRDLLTDV